MIVLLWNLTGTAAGHHCSSADKVQDLFQSKRTLSIYLMITILKFHKIWWDEASMSELWIVFCKYFVKTKWLL